MSAPRPPNPINHEGYDARMNFIRTKIIEVFQSPPDSIETVAYMDWIPFPYNNYIYLLTITSTPEHVHQSPTSVVIPSGTTKLIMRLPNPDPKTQLNNANRVANEVAGMHLAREALRDTKYNHIIPDVYGWEEGDGKVDGSQGWILMGFKAGIDIYETRPWDTMTLDERTRVLDQMADVFAALKGAAVPEGGMGGLRFDKTGAVCLGELTITEGGPYPSYSVYLNAQMQQKLCEANEAKILDGWKGDCLRGRIEAYLDQGLQEEIDNLKLDNGMVYTHGDFTTANAHFDPETLEITAMFDYDFGHVSLAYDDYFLTLQPMGGTFPAISSACAADDHEVNLQQAMLHGFSDDKMTAADEITHSVSRTWSEALWKRGVKTPRDLPSMKELGEIHWFMKNLAPHQLVHEVMIKRIGEEKAQALKGRTKEALEKWLETRGY